MIGSKVKKMWSPFFFKKSKTSNVGMLGVYPEAIDCNIAVHTQILFWVSVSEVRFQKNTFRA